MKIARMLKSHNEKKANGCDATGSVTVIWKWIYKQTIQKYIKRKSNGLNQYRDPFQQCEHCTLASLLAERILAPHSTDA